MDKENQDEKNKATESVETSAENSNPPAETSEASENSGTSDADTNPKVVGAEPEIEPVKVESNNDDIVVTAEIKTKTENNSKGTAALIMAFLGLIAGCGGLALGYLGYESASKPVTYLSSGTDGNSANFVEGSIADVAETVSKSVVSIVSSSTTTTFFGESYDSAAAGTGIIVTSDGYILTNKHVVSGASEVYVVLDDGTTYENVEIVATDPLNDVAFLKIDGVSDLPAATLGDSKTISVGQQVIAIGNALGQYQNTVTAGIVSGTGRSITATDDSGMIEETLTDMIQTDAAINSGNSGGPLVNAAGEVIGINTATSASGENMGFAIPIASVKGMLNQLIETGTAERAYIGVYSLEITAEVAKAYNLPVSQGAYIYSSSSYSAVISGGPADKAGLKNKDIVTKINGVSVGSAGSLSNLIAEYKPGDTVDLTVIRDGSEMSVKVTLEGYSE